MEEVQFKTPAHEPHAAVPHPDQTSPMTVGPEGFFDDPFDKPQETDSALQSAAREAGWALSNLVDEIKFEKRQKVVNIINLLAAALAYSDRRAGHGK